MADELDELTRALDRSLSTAGVAADDDLRRAVDTESKLYTGRTAAIDELTRSAELGKLTKQGGYLWPDEEKTLADLEQAATLPDVERLASKRKQTFQQVQQARERERELRQEDSVIGRSVTALRDTFVPKPATARVPTPEQAIETARSQPATPTHALQKFALPAEEEAFQSWYHQTFPQLHPNPDDPRHFYDYRAYFKAILAGEADDPTPDLTDRDPETGQPRLHMDSRFKLSGHPREYLDTPQGRLHTPTGRVTPSASSSDVDLELPEIQVTAPPLEQKPLVFTDRAGNVTRTVVPTPEDALNLTGQPTSEGFASAFAKGMQGGMYQVGAAAAGTVQRLTPDSMVGDVAEAFERAAREYGPNRVMAAKPWFERLTNPEYLGNLLGNAAIQTAPSLAAFMGGTLAGGPVVGTVAMAGTIYLQTAGEAYREALKGFAAQGLSPEDAEVKAYYASGFAGLVSAAVNALAVPASMVEPFKAKLTNLVLQWGLNVGVDTADQLTQNILAASTYDPTRSITEGLPETVVASGLMSAPETMGAVKSVISGPAVARERIPTPEEAIQPTAPKKPSGPMTQAPFGVEPTPKTGLTPAQAATRLQHLQQLVNPIPPELQVQTPDQRPPFLIKQPSVSPSPEAIPIAPSAMPIEPSELTDLGQSQATPTERPVSPELGVQTSPVSEPVTLPELAATTPKKPESYQPAFPPRHEMPPEQNAELLARAQKAQADLDLSIGGQGGYNTEFDVGPGQGEITGFKSANADWYKEATNPEHPNEPALSRKRVQVAVQKILHDQGRDVGKDVDRVKQLLLGDPEFMGSPFAPKTEEDWRGLIDEALAPYQPSSGLPPELEGLSIFQPKPKPTTRKESRSEPEFPTPEAAIEEAAHEAATSPTNALPEPTQPQKEAGNYKKGHVRIAGLDISIENPQGSTRSGTDASGKPWSVEMQSHYGYIRGTKGKDKDHLDVFIKPGTTDDYRGTVYVVDQNQPGTKTFDEHKIVLGASSIEEAKRLYLDNYTKDWTGLGAISAVEMPQFKAWLQSGQTTKPFHRPENSYRQSEKTQPAGQQAISVPPPTIGERPLIAREPTPEEAPLLSKGSQVPTPEQVSLDEAPLSIPQPEEAIAPSTPTYATAAEKIGTFIQQELQAGRSIAPESLFRLADTEFGGTRAQGAYQEKDAYDAMELGVNKYLSEVGGIRPDGSAQSAQETVDWIRLHILDLIPTQRLARTEEQNEFQQFSTPPDLGFVMNWVANIAGPQAPDSIRGADVVLEPSAGLGGLAVFAKNTGATVYVNELSPRRAALLQQLDFDRTFTENAEQLNNVLPKDVRPTVIIMNPPFSSTAGRKEGERASLNAIAHLGQALKRLEPNGRLVALVGKPKEGMKPSQGFATALSMLGNQYAFRAQIGVSGKRYQKYGTTFDNQILVFDKIAPTGQAPLSAFVDDVRDAIPLLKEIRDARRYSTADRSTQPASPEPRSEAVAPGSRRRRAEGGPTVPPPTDVVGGDRGEPALGERTGENLEGSTTRPALDDVRSEEPGLRPAPDGGRREPVRRRHESRPEHPPERPEPEGRGLESPGRLSQRDQRPAVPRSDVSDRVTVESTPEETAPEPGESATDNAVFDTYRPKRLKIDGAKGHPAKLVESAAMAAVDPPPATYQLALPKSLIESGKLSLAQLESTVYAGQAHAQHLPDGTRKGFFVGDGTGVGKGREVSAVILDNWMQGRTKAIWVSKNDDLLASASRDWTDLGQSADQLFGHDKIKPSGRIDRAQGILFTTYNKLAIGLDATAVGGVKQKEGKSSRLQQIVEWVGKDFDGVIAFDEAHEMRNNVTMKGARGAKKPAMKALAGVELQRALPNARIVYFSATGGIEPSDFGYAERLGMWGAGTPFADKGTFATEVQKGGLATMEVFAQELKANGLYVARSLSFDDVTYERMTHPLTPQQRAVYDEMAKAWQIVYANIQEALAITGANQNGQAKGNARAKFYSAQQRFFSQVLTALQMPTVLERIQQDLDAGHAVVIQLYNTNEAQQDRELERIEQEGGDLSEVDLSPKKILLEYLDKAYPTQQFETYTDEDGNERSRPVVDSEKRPVKNAEAEAAKQALLERFGAPGFLVPDGALEQIINTFGPDTVAEITGRSERIVRTRLEDGTVQEVRQKRSESLPMKEAAEFMADKRNILVFSNAGSTGQSFHADLTKKNQRRRMHYLVQPGWQADIAMQGLGRTHRTNQKSAPNYLLVSTDLNGHKRFISTIARRLSQLGALTRGQRQTSQGLFSEKDNLENSYARGALRQLILDLKRGPVEEFSWSDVTDKLGFDRLLDKTGNINESHLPTIPQFLNRILTLEYEVQNRMFTAFTDRMDRAIEMAAAKGELDTGLENYKAASVVLAKEQVVHADPQTKAETKLLTFDTKQEVRFHAFDSLRERSSFQGFYAGIKTGKVYGTFTGYPHIDEKGNVEEQIRLSEPDVTKTRFVSAKTFKEHYRKLTEKDARPRWEQIIRESPPFRDEPLHLLAGSLLRIWDRLPKSNVRVLRVTDEAGKKYVGRILKPDEVGPVLERLGVQGGERTTYTPADALEAMEAGQTVELANGWKIGPRLVGGETRFELIGDDVYPFRDELRKAGVQIESRQFKTRFFLPTDRAKDILESLTSTRPIIKIQRAKGGRAVPDFERSVSDEPSAPIFFSQAQRMIESKMPAKASAQQIMGILSPANGVKPDELKWIGLDDFLKTKESFTKNEVLDFIIQNQVQVEEVMKSDDRPSLDVRQKGDQWWTYDMNTNTFLEEYETREDALQAAERQDVASGPTKFQSYQLPGGTNYRELLLTIPVKAKPNESFSLAWDEHERDYYNMRLSGATKDRYRGKEWTTFVPGQGRYRILEVPGRGYVVSGVKIQNAGFQTLEQAKAHVADKDSYNYPRPVNPNEFRSGHWSEPNVLAHVRFNTRMVNGKKVLLLEEIQSDWHQKGRKQGYVGSEPRSDSRGNRYNLVPDAPFKKTWHELVLKRMLRYAAEHGYDSLAWTTGEQQAERYDLSKHIDSITYNTGTRVLSGYKGDKNVIDKLVEQDKVADFIGKEAAARLMKSPTFKSGTGYDVHKIDGESLKIGGEGMKDFYDDILPRFVNKYGKKWGASVGTLNIQAGPNEKALREAERRGDSAAIGDALGGPATVHALPITESMKRSVTTAGQPLFQAARRLKAPSYEAFKEALAKAQPIGTSSHILVDSSKQYPKGLLSRLASAPYVQSLSDALSSVFDVLQRSLQSSKPDYSRITYRGLSPDDYYLGVNLDGQKLSASGTDPDAVILNPWVTSWYIQEAMRSGVIREADAVEYVAGKLLDTLLHEMTHRQIRTTHTDANAQAFSRHLDENYGIVGLDRLKSLQRQLMQALEDADALTHLDRDQREQERFWRQGARLPLQTFGGFAKSPRAGNRQNVAGEGTRGRTGPPTTLRGRPEDSTAPLGPGPAFQRRETKPVTPAPDVRRATELPVPRTPSTPAQLFDGFDLPSETTADLLRRRFQDKFIRVRRTQEAIQQAGGLVPEKTNVYLAEELFHGRVETRLKLFEKEYVKPLVHAITTNGLTLSQVEEYLYARHAPERNAKIAEINPKFRDPESPGSGMTNDEAAAVLQGFDEKGLTPALEEVSGYVDDLNTERLRIIEEAGLETPETVQTWRDAYHYYVPLKGRADLEERPRTGKGFDIRGKESQRALGRKSLAKNLLAHTVAQAEETIVRAEKNRVGERFLNLARRYQNPKLWEINRTNLTPYFDERSGEVRYRKDQRLKLADNVLSVKQDGKAYLITIHDKALAAAMKNLGVERSGMIVRGLAAVNHYLAIVNTGGNPEFVLSNFDRDAQTAAIHLSGEQSTKMAAQVMASLPKAMKGIALQQLGKPGGEWGRAYEDLQAAGGKVGFFGLRTLDEIQRELIATVRDAEGSAARTALKMIRGVKDLIFAANEVVENAARLAAFKVAQEHGFTTEAAASLAKNLTVNFNRKGELGPMMNALWLFYNAGLQGSVRMFQALKHPKVQAAALGIVLASVALSALNRAIGGDDEDRLNRYDKVPDGIKERNLILMRPDGSYFKLPLPYGYNIFHVLGQQMEAVLHGSKTPIEGSVTLFSAIWNAFNPLGGEKTLLQSVSPTITDPLVELSTNRDWTGRPIKPEQSRFELKKPESQLYWSSVSPTSKAIAQWLNEATGGSTIRPGAIDISPEVLDYLVGELTGGAGSFINRATNAVIKLSRGEEIPLRKIPFVRVFAGDPPEYRSAQDFFKFGEEVKRTMAEYEAVATTHTPEAEVFKRTHAPILSLRGPLREAERAIEELQARRRAVDASRWPDDRKEQERESIGQAIELRRKNFNRLYRTVIEEERPVASFAHEEQLLQRRLQRRERQAQRRFPDVIAPPAP